MAKKIKSSPRRKYQTDKQQLLEQIDARLANDNHTIHQHNQLMAVKQVLLGATPSFLSKVYNVHTNTITNWVRVADTLGIEKLIAPRKKAGGRTSMITEEMLEDLRQRLEENNPLAHNVEVWDAPRVARYLSEKYGVKCSRETARTALHKVGGHYAAPRLFPSKDREGLAQKQSEYREELRQRLQDPNVIPVYQDESHLYLATDIGRSWYIGKERPNVRSSASRKSKKASGFFLPTTGELYSTEPDWFRWDQVIESFCEFTKMRPLQDGEKYLMILDNASWHVKAVKMIQTLPEYADVRKKMDFLFLPPYSPELNPIERVWRRFKMWKRNVFFDSMAALNKWFDTLVAKSRGPNSVLYGIGLSDIGLSSKKTA